MGKDVIIACDFSSKEEVMTFLEKFGERRPYVSCTTRRARPSCGS